jgi:hypothetical protein
MEEQMTPTATPNIVIDRLRVVTKMTQCDIPTFQDLAVKSGLNPNTLVRILAGYGWQSGTLTDLAVTLQCHPFDLLVVQGFAAPSLGTPGDPLTIEYR